MKQQGSFILHAKTNKISLFFKKNRAKNGLNEDDGIVELGVEGLQVFQSELFVEHFLVERHRKAAVDKLSVKQCL